MTTHWLNSWIHMETTSRWRMMMVMSCWKEHLGFLMKTIQQSGRRIRHQHWWGQACPFKVVLWVSQTAESRFYLGHDCMGIKYFSIDSSERKRERIWRGRTSLSCKEKLHLCPHTTLHRQPVRFPILHYTATNCKLFQPCFCLFLLKNLHSIILLMMHFFGV